MLNETDGFVMSRYVGLYRLHFEEIGCLDVNAI